MSHEDWVQVRGEVSPDSVARVRDAVIALPAPLVTYLRASGIQCVVCNTICEVFPRLANKHPSGYPTDTTHENTCGAYVTEKKTALIAETYVGHITGQIKGNAVMAGVARHEIGHALDHAIGHYSRGKPFAAAHSLDAAGIQDRERFAYYLQPGWQGTSEVFGEMFAQRFGGGGDDVPLAAAFPRCAAKVALVLEHLHLFRPNPQR